MTLWIVLAAFVLLQAVIRLAPTDSVNWHVDPFTAANPAPGGTRERLAVPLPPKDALMRLDAVASTWPRTRRLKGTVEEGRITYVTRSVFWGFPDYTTISTRPHEAGAEIALLARLRFGRHDFGVNHDRVRDWIKVAEF